MRPPTDVLRDEHAIILRGLDVLEAAARQAEDGRDPPDRWWADVLAWFQGFAEGNHHAKEDTALFPAMIKAGAPAEGGPIDVMLEEHVQGRALLQAMARNAPEERARAARHYAQFLRDHIDKEHGFVFPLAEAVLDEPALEWVAHEFGAVEAEQGHGASLDAARAAVDGLAAALATCHSRRVVRA
jgi:hemerythrin-like domain-containing protein